LQRPYQVIGALLAALASVITTARPAAADDAPPPPDELSPSYLIDGGAIPLFWLPLLGSYALTRTDARDEPLAFDGAEGGAPSQIDHELPAWTIGAAAGVVGAAMVLGDDPSRYHHVKGLAEAMATTTLVGELGKVGFGRHRPDYDPAAHSNDGRRSFPSGHTAHAAAAAMYAGLYLRYHVFADLRPAGSTLPWWEGATYAGLAAVTAGVGFERVAHDRHHLTDVLAGGLLGAGTALAMFVFQEHRYRAADRRHPDSRHDTSRVLPAAQGVGLSFAGTF
jgi:membrane-associated phospholipid phosphatase